MPRVRSVLSSLSLLSALSFAASGCHCHRQVVVMDAAVPINLDGFLKDHPVPAGAPLLAVKVGETATASYHVIQVRGGETPHIHRDHDLVVTVLRGKGELHLGESVLALRCGDTVMIPRGTRHWFVNTSRHPAVAFATFSPPSDGTDMVPSNLTAP